MVRCWNATESPSNNIYLQAVSDQTMRLRFTVTIMLLGLLLANAGWADPERYREMLVNYGTVPDAILDPPAEEQLDRTNSSLLSNLLWGSVGHARVLARAKACYANQRVALGAIEMYNMDNSTVMTTLDLNDLVDPAGQLIAGKYLRNKMIMPEAQCRLRNYGNLSETGVIYCDYHGTLPDDKEGLRIAAGYTPKAHRANAENNSMLPVFIVLAVLSAGLMIVLHRVLPKAPQ